MTRKEIGCIIRESRQMAGLTQLQVAETLGRPQQTIAAWENGRSQPDANTLFELFRVLGRSLDEAFGFAAESFQVSAHERAHIEKYRALDIYGQDTVASVLDCEYKRCTEQAHTAKLEEPGGLVYTMPEYYQSMSAGTGQPADDSQWENLLLVKEPPRSASYVARVSGDSMEPTFHDGVRLFIRATVEIRPGQIGVFFMDGQQWVKELGDGVLLSHNPAYAPIPLRDDIRCQGLVLGVCDDGYIKGAPASKEEKK